MSALRALVFTSTLAVACGDALAPIGVMVNGLGVAKESAGPTRVDPAAEGYVDAKSLTKLRQGNVIGDDAVDSIVELSSRRGVEIHDGSGSSRLQLTTAGYLTGFAVIDRPGAAHQSIVLYTYPNQNGGGTFEVVQPPDTTPAFTWTESPAPGGGMGIGEWNGAPALFYLKKDDIVVRNAEGTLLATFRLPGGDALTNVFPATLASGYTVIVASGDGYTPFHAVAIFDAQGMLVYHEQAKEHAFRVTAGTDHKSFTIDTRTAAWRYRLP